MKPINDQLLSDICRSLRYAEIFEASLSLQQLHARLLGKHVVSMKDLQKFVANRKEFVMKKGYISLRGSSGKVENPNPEIWKKKLQEARRAAKILCHVPWVLGVFVTGSVGAENAHKDDDIDLMIITESNRLWLSRFIIVPILILMRKYQDKNQMQAVFPHRSPQTSNRWCLNLWLDERSLEVPKMQQSLYSAHEVLLAKCIFQRKNMEKRFLTANSWVGEYFAHPPVGMKKKIKQIKRVNKVLNVLDMLAYQIQRWYMKKSHTSEKVSESFAYFHPRDTASIVMKNFRSLHADDVGRA